MDVKLSILIATMPSRRRTFNLVVNDLIHQNAYRDIPQNVEFLFDDSLSYNIGTKRNKLLSRASGEYIVMVDDDDAVSHYYIDKILNAIESKPDCIGISGEITTNGRDCRQWHISKEYGSWYEKAGIYYRTPNHISPVRRELALQAGFPEIPFGEDHIYSMRLLPLLKTEIIIPGNLYYYKYVSNK